MPINRQSMYWDDVCFVVPTDGPLNSEDASTYSLFGDESLIKTFSPRLQQVAEFDRKSDDYDELMFPDYEGDAYLIVVAGLQVVLFIDEGIELIHVFHPSLEYDPTWMIQLILRKVAQGEVPTFNAITTQRYNELYYATLRSEFNPQDRYDLFATHPETTFRAHINTEPTHNLGTALTQLNRSTPRAIIKSMERLYSHLTLIEKDNNHAIIAVIIELSHVLDQFKDNLGLELILIKLNIYSSFFDIKLSDGIPTLLAKFASSIREQVKWFNMNNAEWIIDAFNGWFNDDTELAPLDQNATTIPRQLTLLPYLIKYSDDDATSLDEIQHLIELNFKVLADTIPYFGIHHFQQLLGRFYLKLNDYANARTYFDYAGELYTDHGYTQKAIIARTSALRAEIEHYTELALAANLFHYTGRSAESSAMAWSALTSALNIVKKIILLELSKVDMLDTIIQFYDRCRRPLVADTSDEKTQVIELKLDELKDFFISIQQETVDTESLQQMVEMHIESLRFLKPAKPPRFMLMTLDGRLIDTQEAVEDQAEVSDSTLNHLIAGALTAIRSILQEATQSSGFVKEINAGDSILLLEARSALVLVTVATTVDDKLRRLTNDLADRVQEMYGSAIRDWYGDSVSMEPVRELIRETIVKELV